MPGTARTREVHSRDIRHQHELAACRCTLEAQDSCSNAVRTSSYRKHALSPLRTSAKADQASLRFPFLLHLMYNPDDTAAMQLLHVSHMHAHADEHANDSSSDTFKLRLAAIFVILAAGLLGKHITPCNSS